MDRKELIKKYIEFFKKKNHKVIPNESLIPKDDPTVLFTTAGMHPLVPFLLGQPHPLGKKLVNVQRCIRTGDIEEVGNSYHHTFFEMLGNWSLGDYFKEEAIKLSFEFLTKVLEIPLEKIAITCFKGDDNIKKDEESAEIWKSLGIPKERIAFLGKEDNWWGPAGKTGPCGPDTEIFYWKLNNVKAPKKFNPKDENWVEIWNDVLMEYIKKEDGNYVEANQKNIDTGMGVERTVAVLNGLEDNYFTDMWQPIIKKIEIISGKNYGNNKKIMRIIADHIKAAVFIISDGVKPSNTEQGYVLRRLIRRAIRYEMLLGITEKNCMKKIAEPVFEIYADYENLRKKTEILKELEIEEKKFKKTIQKGISIFEKLIERNKSISGSDAFLLYQSYGFPIEMTLEMLKEKNLDLDEKKLKKEFEKENKKHQELSRTASKGKFKSGLADESEKTKKLHTATHLINEALRIVLKENVKQKGSNINPQRLRFDFDFPRKVTEEELVKVENLVNKKIKKGLEVKKEEKSLKKALEEGAGAEFGDRYPDRVYVYTILDPSDNRGWVSKEICTGPHVKNTKEIGKIKIVKEESVARGIRRIRAVLV